MMNAKQGRSWVVKITGKTITLISNKHCLLLVRYDLDENLVYVNDPLKEITAYNKEVFEKRFYQFN